MPMVSAPPGRFSTTTLAPSCLASSGASRRATLSVALPAACGTIMRIGRSGYCAAALPARTSSARAAARWFKGSGLQLAAHFAALVLGGMHVDVSLPGLERLQLRGGELAALRHAVGVAVLGERHDDRPVLALGALVDMGLGARHALGGHAAADGAVLGDAEAAAARARSAHRRHFLGAGQVHAHRAAARHPGGHLVAYCCAGGEGQRRARAQQPGHGSCHRSISSVGFICGTEPAARIFLMPKITASEALSRLRILDLSRVRAGPTCVKQFADFGADVIKIESPPGVDANEGMGGPRDGPDMQNLHRNKRAMTLNLKLPEAREVFYRLVKTADVVVENYRPDVKYRL